MKQNQIIAFLLAAVLALTPVFTVFAAEQRDYVVSGGIGESAGRWGPVTEIVLYSGDTLRLLKAAASPITIVLAGSGTFTIRQETPEAFKNMSVRAVGFETDDDRLSLPENVTLHMENVKMTAPEDCYAVDFGWAAGSCVLDLKDTVITGSNTGDSVMFFLNSLNHATGSGQALSAVRNEATVTGSGNSMITGGGIYFYARPGEVMNVGGVLKVSGADARNENMTAGAGITVMDNEPWSPSAELRITHGSQLSVWGGDDLAGYGCNGIEAAAVRAENVVLNVAGGDSVADNRESDNGVAGSGISADTIELSGTVNAAGGRAVYNGGAIIGDNVQITGIVNAKGIIHGETVSLDIRGDSTIETDFNEALWLGFLDIKGTVADLTIKGGNINWPLEEDDIYNSAIHFEKPSGWRIGGDVTVQVYAGADSKGTRLPALDYFDTAAVVSLPLKQSWLSEHIQSVQSGAYAVTHAKEDARLGYLTEFWLEPAKTSEAANTAVLAVKPSPWAEAQVNAAIAEGLVPAFLQTKYTQAATRAEFCALVVTLYEKVMGHAITDLKMFDDTHDVNVQKAAGIGVVGGVGNNLFAPDSPLTREQAAVMLNALTDAIQSKQAGATDNTLTATPAAFADNDSISAWAIDSVGRVQASGIMSGVSGSRFAPKDSYTREQSIITIKKLFDLVNAARS